MTANTGDLYQAEILQHNREPQNFFKREDATYSLEAYNSVCGDQYHLYFDIEEGNIINISFHGYGCAVSKASASIMTGMLEGKSVEKALAIYKDLITTIEHPEDDGFATELTAFAPVKKHPGRIKCVTLSWDTIHDFLKNSDEQSGE